MSRTSSVPGLPARAASAVLALLFAWSMAMQLDDPDPLAWVIVYGVLAAIAAFAAAGRFWQPLIVAWLVVCAGASLYLMPSVVELFTDHSARDLIGGMSPDRPYVEEARESLGLLVGVAALVFFLVLARRGAGRA